MKFQDKQWQSMFCIQEQEIKSENLSQLLKEQKFHESPARYVLVYAVVESVQRWLL